MWKFAPTTQISCLWCHKGHWNIANMYPDHVILLHMTGVWTQNCWVISVKQALNVDKVQHFSVSTNQTDRPENRELQSQTCNAGDQRKGKCIAADLPHTGTHIKHNPHTHKHSEMYRHTGTRRCSLATHHITPYLEVLSGRLPPSVWPVSDSAVHSHTRTRTRGFAKSLPHLHANGCDKSQLRFLIWHLCQRRSTLIRVIARDSCYLSGFYRGVTSAAIRDTNTHTY